MAAIASTLPPETSPNRPCRAQHDGRVPGGALDGLRARLTWPRRPDAFRPGTKTRHEIVVENTGSEWWPRGPVKPEIRLGYRWFDPPATQTFGEGRAYFTEAV